MSQYHSMRRRESESSQDFSDKFMKIYNVIPTQFKPPPSSAQLQYVEAFDSEFTLWLSKRKSSSLVDMTNDAIEVEVNMNATKSKNRDEGEWIREEGEIRKEKNPEQPSSSNPQEAKMDMMMKTMEKLMENIIVDSRPPHREGQE